MYVWIASQPCGALYVESFWHLNFCVNPEHELDPVLFDLL